MEHNDAIAAKTDDPVSSTTVLVGVVGTIIVFVICVLLQVLYYRSIEAEQQRKVVDAKSDELRLMRVEQLEQIGDYRWIDRENGVVGLPIERAMELVADEYGRRDR